MEGAFFKNYIESAGALTTPELDDDVPTPGDEAASIVVDSSANGGSSDLKRLYLLLIASARRTIDVASPYFVIDESTLWAFEDAVARGVRIRILTEGPITDAMSVKYASRHGYERAAVARDRGVPVPADHDAREGAGRGRRLEHALDRPTSTIVRSS